MTLPLTVVEQLLNHLDARIAAAIEAREPVPVFVGIGDLHSAVARAKGGRS